MCLDYVEKIWLTPKDRKWKVGYKIVKSIKPDWFTTASTYSQLYKDGVNKDKDEGFLSVWNFTKFEHAYPTGYHIWVNLDDAIYDKLDMETLIKVEYRKVVAVGKNHSFGDKIFDCVVAKELKFVEVIQPAKNGGV